MVPSVLSSLGTLIMLVTFFIRIWISGWELSRLQRSFSQRQRSVSMLHLLPSESIRKLPGQSTKINKIVELLLNVILPLSLQPLSITDWLRNLDWQNLVPDTQVTWDGPIPFSTWHDSVSYKLYSFSLKVHIYLFKAYVTTETLKVLENFISSISCRGFGSNWYW